MKMKNTLAIAAALALGATGAVAAQAQELPTPEQMWRIIQQQQEQIQELRSRLGETRQEVRETAERVEEVSETAGGMPGMPDNVQISGLVEVEYGNMDTFAGVDGSDITLATVEIGLDAQINEWVSASILLKYEEDATPLDVDTGTITIGNLDQFPVYLTAGMTVVPFGAYSSNMLADPLTLDLGESSETIIQVGFESGGFYGSAWGFNGTVPITGKGDFVNQYGANVGLMVESGEFAMDIGASWTNSIDDSGTSEGIATIVAGVSDHVDGYGLYGVFDYGPFQLIGEYVGAAESFAAGNLAFNGTGATPAAWNVEAAYNFEVMALPTTAAIGYQGSDEALGLGLAETRYIVTVASEIFDSTSLGIQYNYDEDYSVADGGTGGDLDAITLQLAVAF